jgi:hypothetical protein
MTNLRNYINVTRKRDLATDILVVILAISSPYVVSFAFGMFTL